MSALYLYGVTRPREVPARLAENGVHLVVSEGRAAIVSELDAAPVEATRRNLLAHADVVEELHERAVVLPARFGLVLEDPEAALELLALPELESQLERHREQSELTLKGTYEESVLAEVSAALEPLRDMYRQAPTMENGVALGEAVTEALFERRTRDREELLARLGPFLQGVVVGDPAGELDALELALLVRRDAVEQVSQALEGASAVLSPPLHLRLVGPLPPYSFVSLELPAPV